MHPRWKLLSTLVAGSLLVTAARASADDGACASDPDAAGCYLAAAQRLKDTEPGEAAKLYLAAYRVSPKIDPLAGYGLALALDKQYVAAAEALEKATEEYEKLDEKFRDSSTDAQIRFAVVHRLELVRERLREIAPNIGRVRLASALPGGVTVMRKGGDDVRHSDPTKLIVRPGGDVLVFSYPSGRTFELPVNVVGGLITTVEVPPEPPPPAPEVAPIVVTTADPGAKQQQYAYIAGGAGAGLFAIGLGYTLIADAPKFELSAVLVGSGLVGIGVGAYFWYGAKSARSASTTAVVPMIGSDVVGAALVGRL